jgi:RimJ/RimL family protein N-acetyltransferase
MAQQHMKWTRLISLILPGNHASQAVAKRIGGVLEKTIPFRDGTAEIYVYPLGKPLKASIPSTNK